MNRIGRSALLALGAFSTTTAQMPTDHHSGLVVPANIDGDACGDFFVYDGRGFHAWQGLAGAPWVRRMQSTLEHLDRRVSRPVGLGSHLYVPLLGNAFNRLGGIAVYAIQPDGALTHFTTHRIDPLTPGAMVNSLRLARLPFDAGGDGVEDLLAVWSESPRQRDGIVCASIVDRVQVGPVFALQLTGAPAASVQLANLFAARHATQPSDEFVMVVSKEHGPGLDRFGFVNLTVNAGGIGVASSWWVPGAPAVRPGGWGDAWASCAYGQFSPMVALASPVVAFQPGPSIAFDPDPSAPFVALSGSWIDTSTSGFLLEDAVADFDGDGADEVVIVERELGPLGDVVAITDPHVVGRRFQAFSYRYGHSGPRLNADPSVDTEVFHGAAVDVNGDGRSDLVLTVQAGAQGGLSLVMADANDTRSGNGCYRVH